MKRQQPGDSIGELDADGIAVWYPNCKVRFDGSHYIATPHTTNRTRHRKHREQVIAVSIEDGKFSLEKEPEIKPVVEPVTPSQMTVEEAIEAHEKSPPESTGEPKKAIRHTTRKQIFDELYEKYLYLKPRERKQTILNDMRPLFENENALKVFVGDNCLRRWRNLVVRRQRFARKAYNRHFRYFATFTYSDEKHTEESFKKRLLQTLRRLATRKHWLYMGVWERGKETGRLHFHALVYIPDGGAVGEFEEVTDYNKKTGKRKTIIQNTFFAEKFGRNEFDDISFGDIIYGKAIAYIMKYMEKNNEKVVYSRGLYEFFRSDIQGADVVAKMEIIDETDNRLVLASDFTCWDEGVKVGEVSPETIAMLPKSS